MELCKNADVMHKNAHIGWDDLIFVLAVADHGSVSAAATALSVNHATVLRRIAAFEERQGVRIFDKTPRGYQVSSDRRALLEVMRTAGEALSDVDRMIDAERPRLSGGLRITSTDTLAQFLLAPVIAGLSDELDLAVEFRAENAHVDFKRMEAHITVRPAVHLPNDLKGERAGTLWLGVYASSKDVPGWLGMSGPLSRSVAAEWVRNNADFVDVSSDSFLTLAALAASGKGKTLLPTFIGDNWPGLTCLEKPSKLPHVPLWVASHVDFANSGRLKRARRFIVEKLKEMPELSKP